MWFERLADMLRTCAAASAFLVFLAGMPFAATAAADKTVTLATLPNYSPYAMYASEQAQPAEIVVPPGQRHPHFEGFSWDVLREAFHSQDYTVRLRIVPWSRAMQELRAGKVDLLFPTGKNAERLSYMAYSEEPVNVVDFHIYVRADSEITWQGLDTFAGGRVAVMPGWNYGDAWKAKERIEKHPVESVAQGFELLKRGRIDGFAGYELPWERYLNRTQKRDAFRKLPEFGGTAEYVTALENNPQAEKLLAIFDRGKRQLSARGRIAELRQRWQ